MKPNPNFRNPPPPPGTAGPGEGQGGGRPHGCQPAAKPYRRFGRGVGFWLGAVLLGLGGCVLGVWMPYRHPVAVASGVLWWGIYFGCFGASLGALVGLWAEQPPVPPPQEKNGDFPQDARGRKG
jgi:hypothetical protein